MTFLRLYGDVLQLLMGFHHITLRKPAVSAELVQARSAVQYVRRVITSEPCNLVFGLHTV